jgi:hypothetical protein
MMQPMQLTITDDLNVDAISFTPAVGTGGVFYAPMVPSVGTSGMSTSVSN